MVRTPLALPITGTPPPRVLLFRTPVPGDTYPPSLGAAGYASHSIPALEDEYVGADALREAVSRGARAWEGVIITSRRAGMAWARAVRQLQVAGWSAASDPDFVPWSSLRVYSPGPAVGTEFAVLPEAFRPTSVTAVSAAQLAPIILRTPARGGGDGDKGVETEAAPEGNGPATPTTTAPPAQADQSEADPVSDAYRPYLMLVGDKTLPTLPNALARAGRTVHKLKVYATREAASLGADVRSLVLNDSSIPDPADGAPTWAVLFSPSSAACVLPHLDATGWAVREGDHGRMIRLAAIGDTTAAYLSERGWRLDAVARTPDPPGVVAALCASDGRTAGQ